MIKSSVQTEKIYHQLLDLLEDLVSAYAHSGVTDADEEETDAAAEEVLIESLMEEAVERGLDEEHVERILKSIAAFARKQAEE